MYLNIFLLKLDLIILGQHVYLNLYSVRNSRARIAILLLKIVLFATLKIEFG